MRSVALSDVTGPTVITGAGTVGTLTLEGIRHDTSKGVALVVQTGVHVTNLVIRNASGSSPGSTNYLLGTYGGPTIDRVTVTQCEWRGARLINMTNAADVITETDVDHIVLNGGPFVGANIVGAVVGRVFLSNARLLNGSSGLDVAGTTDVFMHNVEATTGILYRATSNVTVRGSGMKFGLGTKAAGAVIRSLSPLSDGRW